MIVELVGMAFKEEDFIKWTKTIKAKVIKEEFIKLKKSCDNFSLWEEKCIELGDKIKLDNVFRKVFGSGRNLCYALFWYWVDNYEL